MNSGMRIGVRGFPPGIRPPQIDTFEIDALDPTWSSSRERRRLRASLRSHQGLTLAFGHFFLRGKDPSDRRERARCMVEKFALFGAEASQILVPPSLLGSDGVNESLVRIREEFHREELPLPGIDLPSTAMRGPAEESELVGDPAWNPIHEEYRKRQWRIHGYHSTRWIRLYSVSALETLARNARRFQPERVIFAHSQKFAQAVEFAETLILRARKEPTNRSRSIQA